MNLDLSSALHDAADRAAADRDTIPAGPVLTRIRRRHAIRTATSSAVGVAAAGAVAFGGLRLAEQREAPPAGPTPTATSGADALACGTVVADVPTVAATADPLVSVDVTLPDGAVVDQGGELVASTTKVFRSDAGVDDGLGHATSAVAVADGVVVGVFAGTIPVDTQPLSGRLGMVERYRLQPRSCEDLEAPLAAGTYELLLQVAEVGMSDGTTEAGPFLSEVRTVTVLPGLELPSATALPACGETIDGLTSTAGEITGEARVRVGVLDAGSGEFLAEGYGDMIDVALPLRSTAPVTVRGSVTGWSLVVTRDGVTVATAEGSEGDADASAWEPGTVVWDTGLAFSADACGGAGEYLGAGDYVLWARVEGWANLGEGLDTDGFEVLYDPVPFTIHEFEDVDNEGGVTWTSDGPVTEEALG